MRAPRPPRPRQQKTERQKRTEAYKAAWERSRVYETAWEENRRRDDARHHTTTARTIQKHQTITKSLRRIRGQDLAQALEQAGDATGDPRFAAALEAVKMYGFDREFQRTVAREQIKRFGDTHDGYLVQVDFLHQYGKLENEKRRRQLSVLEACECVVAECGLGFSFEAEVERLRKAFLTRNLGSMRSIPSLDRLLMGLTVMRISADGKFGQKVVPLKT